MSAKFVPKLYDQLEKEIKDTCYVLRPKLPGTRIKNTNIELLFSFHLSHPFPLHAVKRKQAKLR